MIDLLIVAMRLLLFGIQNGGASVPNTRAHSHMNDVELITFLDGYGEFKRTHRIHVLDKTRVTFRQERINGSRYMRSLTFIAKDGKEERHIYRSHGSIVYSRLNRTFDLKAIERASGVDERSSAHLTFNVEDFSSKHRTSTEKYRKHYDVIMGIIDRNLDGPALIGQDHLLEFFQTFIETLKFDGYVGPPQVLLFSGPSGVGKNIAVKFIARAAGCTLFATPPLFFDKNFERRVPALFYHANEKATNDGRHCIVFIDHVDGVLNKASKAKVNAFKKVLNDASSYSKVVLILATNHINRLTNDEGVRNCMSNFEFNALTPEVMRQCIEYNFKHLQNGEHEFIMSDEDWKTLLPTMAGENGFTLHAWCNDVSLDVDIRHKIEKNKEDNIIRLADMQAVRSGLLSSWPTYRGGSSAA